MPARSIDQVKKDLKSAIQIANQNNKFQVNRFLQEFAKQDYFTSYDIAHLIVFLQQTAFDRQFGQERDRLQAKPWMQEHADKFIQSATKLGIVEEPKPKQKDYIGIAIMGAASFRVRTRLAYFKNLNVKHKNVWALSGSRELSKGLDEEDVMFGVANSLNKPVKFVNKPVGTTSRDFLNGITETQMVNYLIQKNCPDSPIGIIESKQEEGHWRANGTALSNNVTVIS